MDGLNERHTDDAQCDGANRRDGQRDECRAARLADDGPEDRLVRTGTRLTERHDDAGDDEGGRN